MRLRLLLAGIACVTALPAAAQVRTVPVQPASEREALRGVDVYLVNEGAAPVPADGPRQIEVTAADGTRLVLERVPGPRETVAPGGFVKARYVPVALAGRALPPEAQHPPAEMPDEAPGETTVQTSQGASSGFLDRFEPHEPVYGAFGLNDAGGKLQVSFAFRPFARTAGLNLDKLRFAYTQTMFWALDKPSGPFRTTTYSPEVYADIPMDANLKVALGWRHDSNGEGPAKSIDVNRIFLRAEKQFDLGAKWRLDIAPQAWFYVGKQGIAPDLKDYWGFTSLTAAVTQQDGLKVAVTGRGSFEKQRGAAELFVSYPLKRLGGGLGIYLFGQAFTGYGEALSDYNRSDRHARIGIAFTR